MTDTEPEYRRAGPADAEAVAALVHAAYRHYIPRLGSQPGPMQLDYREVTSTKEVWLVEVAGSLVAVLVTAEAGDDFVIENVAVHPDQQGRGLGRALLDRAEDAARRRGYTQVLLYTHARMHENLAHYRRRGYVEQYRRPLPDGSELVYLRKRLAEPEDAESV